MSIQTLLNGVVLAGAGVMAIWNILKALGAVKDKSNERTIALIKKVLEEEAPKYFENYTVSQKEKRDNRVKQIMTPMTDALCDIFNDRFDKMEKMVGAQTSVIEELTDSVIKIQDQNSDFLRRELKKVYHKYRRFKKIPQYDYDDCLKMMEDYTGNSYAEDMWKRIQNFEVVEDDDFLDEIEKDEN